MFLFAKEDAKSPCCEFRLHIFESYHLLRGGGGDARSPCSQKDNWLQGHTPGGPRRPMLTPCHQWGPSLEGESKLKTWGIPVSCSSRQHVLEVVCRIQKAGQPPPC